MFGVFAKDVPFEKEGTKQALESNRKGNTVCKEGSAMMYWGYGWGWMPFAMLIWLGLTVYFFILLAGINNSLKEIARALKSKYEKE